MKNRLYDLPEEIQRLIYKKVYDNIVEEIRDFIHWHVPYIFRKPNGLNSEQVKLFIRDIYQRQRDKYSTYEFRQAYKYYNGHRQTYFLNFANAFLHLKKHPTGFYQSGDEIEYEYSTDEDYLEIDENDESDENDD
jgi:hypothetical protein